MEQWVCNHNWSAELKTHSLDLQQEMCMVCGVSGMLRHANKILTVIINNGRHSQKDWDTENSF